MRPVRHLQARRIAADTAVNAAKGLGTSPSVAAAMTRTATKTVANNVDAFVALGIKEKVAQTHFDAFSGAWPELQMLADKGATFEPKLASQYTRALQLFLGELATQLDKMQPEDRTAGLRSALSTLNDIANSVSAENTIGALSLLTSLLTDGSKDLASFQQTCAVAAQFTQVFLQQNGTKDGCRSALFALRNLIEEATGRHQGLSLTQRQQIWQQISSYLSDTTAKAGFSLATLSRQCERFSQALQAEPRAALTDVMHAVAKATHEASNLTQPARDAALEAINTKPNGAATTNLDNLQNALRALVTRERHESDAFYVNAVNIWDASVRALNCGQLGAADALEGVAQMIALANGNTQTAGIIRFLGGNMPLFLRSGDTRAVLQQALNIGDAQALPRMLITLGLALYGIELQDLQFDLRHFDKILSDVSSRAMMALLPQLSDRQLGALFEPLIAEAQAGMQTNELTGFAKRFLVLHSVFAPFGDALAGLAATVAKANLPPAHMQRLAEIAEQVKAHAPKLPIVDILLPGADGSSGLFGLKNPDDHIHDVLPQLYSWLQQCDAIADPATQIAVARKMIHAAVEVSRLDRDPATLQARISTDLSSAIANPGKLQHRLKGGHAIGVQAQGKKTLPSFLKNHAELPPELVFTAGMHLTEKQMGWLCNTIAESSNRGDVRLLRDVVYASVQGRQLSFIDAVVNAKDAMVARQAMELVAQNHRRAITVPFTKLTEGLNQGVNPAVEIHKIAVEEAAKRLVTSGVDKDGIDQLKKINDRVTTLTTYVSQDGVWEGVKRTQYQAALIELTTAIANGSYAALKYTGPIADRQLRGLSPAQIEIWQRSLTVRPDASVAPAAESPKLQEAFVLARGVCKALEGVSLQGPGFETIGWNAESRDALRGRRDQLVADVKAAAKGSVAHKEAAGKIDAVHARLHLLELYCAITEAANDPPKDLAKFLVETRPLTDAAARAATGGVRDALLEVFHVTTAINRLETGALQGEARNIRAVDTDRIEHTFTVYDNGCMGLLKNQNSPALIEFMRSAMYRTLLAFDAQDRPVVRGQIRLMPIEQDGYKRHALYIDMPVEAANKRGVMTPEAVMLYLRAGLRKAKELGVAAALGDNISKQKIAEAAALEGGTAHALAPGKVTVDYGVLGVHHSEHIGIYWTKPESAESPAVQNLKFTRVEFAKSAEAAK